MVIQEGQGFHQKPLRLFDPLSMCPYPCLKGSGVTERGMNLASILSLGGTLGGGNPADKLHKAAQAGDVDKVLGLLQAQPGLLDHRCPGDSDGFTVLHEAVALGHTALVAALLRHCAAAAPQQLRGALEARDARGRTPVHWAARVRGAEAILQDLVEVGGRAVLAQSDPAGRLPIHYAAHYGNVEQLRLILREGGEGMLTAQDSEGDTALHEACREGRSVAAWAMLCEGDGGQQAAGALVGRANSLGQLPSHMAAMFGHVDLLQLLVAKAAPPAHNGRILACADQKGKTCAHYAAVGGHLSVVAYVVSKLGGSACSAEDEYLRGPLYYAAAEGHQQLCEYVVVRGGLELVLRADRDGQRPSHAATQDPQIRDYLERMEGLLRLEMGLAQDEARVLTGAFAGGASSTGLLSSEDRKKSFRSNKDRRRSMQEDLTDALGSRDTQAVARLVEQHPRLLFEANASGDVPLMAAAFYGDLGACQAMVESGGQKLLRHQNDDGETALHVASSQDHQDVALWMASVGGPDLIRMQARDGQTALHYAAQRNYVPLAQGLVEAGGVELLDIPDNQGLTVWDAAQSVAMKAALEEKVRQLQLPSARDASSPSDVPLLQDPPLHYRRKSVNPPAPEAAGGPSSGRRRSSSTVVPTSLIGAIMTGSSGSGRSPVQESSATSSSARRQSDTKTATLAYSVASGDTHPLHDDADEEQRHLQPALHMSLAPPEQPRRDSWGEGRRSSPSSARRGGE